MRYLLDTQCWLWMQAQPDRLGMGTLTALQDEANELLLSAASSWEIAIKHGLGKLALPAPPERYVPDRMTTSGVTPLPVTHAHALHVAGLPPHHRDPFDRLLVAQAQIERATLLSSDRAFAAYDVAVHWVEE